MDMRSLITLVESAGAIQTEARAKAVIRAVKKFARDKPIAIEMKPYLNRYTGECQGVVLTDLFADRPGQGVGTSVMTYLLAKADQAGLNVHTDAEGPRSYDFYVNLGFERDRFSGHQLVHFAPYTDDDDE